MKIWSVIGTNTDGDIVISLGLTKETAEKAYEANLRKRHALLYEDHNTDQDYETWVEDCEWIIDSSKEHEVNE